MMDKRLKLTMGTLAKTKLHAPDFLTKKRSILLFLSCVCVLAIVFIVINRPMGFMSPNIRLSQRIKPLYTIIVVGTGFITLIISRILLYYYQKRHKMRLLGYVVWLLSEVAVFTLSLSVLAHRLNVRPDVQFTQLLSRIFIDVISILLVPYTIAVLIYIINVKRREIDALHAMITDQTEGKPVTTDTINFFDKGGRLVFATKKNNVLYIEASDNYTNIHYINGGCEDRFILHNSMKNVESAYAKMGMMRCHRGYLVNLENVKLIRKEKDGLVIELTQSNKTIPVSKSYADKVAHSFAGLVVS